MTAATFVGRLMSIVIPALLRLPRELRRRKSTARPTGKSLISSRALALMTGAFGLGQIVGPVFAGIVSDRLGTFTVPSLAAVAALLLAAVLVRR